VFYLSLLGVGLFALVIGIVISLVMTQAGDHTTPKRD